MYTFFECFRGPRQALASGIAIAILWIAETKMPFTQVLWDLDDDPKGNVQHIGEHDVTKEEVEEVLERPDGIERSRSSGFLIAFGGTTTGRLIAVVFEEIDDAYVYPVTAYEVE
jgi:hypothetical protein